MNINNIPHEKQFSYLLNKQRRCDAEEQILLTDFTSKNLNKLRQLFKQWREGA